MIIMNDVQTENYTETSLIENMVRSDLPPVEEVESLDMQNLTSFLKAKLCANYFAFTQKSCIIRAC